MPVFDAAAQKPVRVADPGSDQKLPPGGGLNYGSIASATALGGTTGADCMKVNGDRWQEMDGKLTENYTKDKEIKVLGKHTEKITGNRSISVLSGNIERNVSAGKVTDTIAQSHEEKVGMKYEINAGTQWSVQTMKGEITAGAMLDLKAGGMLNVTGTLVKINS